MFLAVFLAIALPNIVHRKTFQQENGVFELALVDRHVDPLS